MSEVVRYLHGLIDRVRKVEGSTNIAMGTITSRAPTKAATPQPSRPMLRPGSPPAVVDSMERCRSRSSWARRRVIRGVSSRRHHATHASSHPDHRLDARGNSRLHPSAVFDRALVHLGCGV